MIRYSADKTSVIYPLLPLNGNTITLINFNFFLVNFQKISFKLKGL